MKTMKLRRMKGSIMAQWASTFVMLKIRPIHISLVGFTASRPSVHQVIRTADEKVVVLEIFKTR